MVCRQILSASLRPPAALLLTCVSTLRQCTDESTISSPAPLANSRARPWLDCRTLSNATRLFVLDEVGMVGRQFMGRIDSRLSQAKAGNNDAGFTLGGVSCICSDDPAQCEAISGQQVYDTTQHKVTIAVIVAPHVALSNAGMTTYDGFTDVVALSTVQRLKKLAVADAPEAKAYNAR